MEQVPSLSSDVPRWGIGEFGGGGVCSPEIAAGLRTRVSCVPDQIGCFRRLARLAACYFLTLAFRIAKLYPVWGNEFSGRATRAVSSVV